MSVICPRCGTKTSLSPVNIVDEKAYLPDSSSETRRIYARAVVFAITDNESPHYTSYGIFECQACYKRFVAKRHINDNEWVPVYPIPHKSIAEEVPEPIKREFEEASLCFAIGAYKACASMGQRTLESLCQNKEVSGLNELRNYPLTTRIIYAII